MIHSMKRRNKPQKIDHLIIRPVFVSQNGTSSLSKQFPNLSHSTIGSLSARSIIIDIWPSMLVINIQCSRAVLPKSTQKLSSTLFVGAQTFNRFEYYIPFVRPYKLNSSKVAGSTNIPGFLLQKYPNPTGQCSGLLLRYLNTRF